MSAMTTATHASPAQREPELLGQTVVVIGGSAGIGLETACRARAEHLLIKTPVRIEQGEADATVFKTFTDQLVTAYTDSGLKVSYTTYPGVSHGGVVDAGAKDATSDIRARLK